MSLTACEFDKAAVPEQPTRLVVHAVLNPFVLNYRVLVEELATGQINIDGRIGADSLDPIVSGGGIPVRDAVVFIREVSPPALDTAKGIEDARVRSDGKGQGVYRFQNAGPPLFAPRTNQQLIQRARRYELIVEWRGQTVRGFTTVPLPDRLVFRDFGLQRFNKDRDTLLLLWPTAQFTKRHALRAVTPYGPFLLFSDRDTLRVLGSLRNVFARDLPNVFIPGFRQEISTAAVDTNYFDYYRSSNNPFTGTGLINHLEGGVGLFGSIVPLDIRRLDVTADQTGPIEGLYLGEAQQSIDLYLGDNLGNDRRFASGSLRRGGSRNGFVGSATSDGRLSLAILRGDYANDTLFVFNGRVTGDSLTGGSEGRPVTSYRLNAPRRNDP